MTWITTVRINDPTIMACHGTKIRTRRSLEASLSLVRDIKSATARVLIPHRGKAAQRDVQEQRQYRRCGERNGEPLTPTGSRERQDR
jgi:hypothetical protein